MTRKRWSLEELAVLPTLTWAEFHERFPERTYDSWEVKRRRIPGATAGRGRRSRTSVSRELADRLATEVLESVERYLAESRGR